MWCIWVCAWCGVCVHVCTCVHACVHVCVHVYALKCACVCKIFTGESGLARPVLWQGVWHRSMITIHRVDRTVTVHLDMQGNSKTDETSGGPRGLPSQPSQTSI